MTHSLGLPMNLFKFFPLLKTKEKANGKAKPSPGQSKMNPLRNKPYEEGMFQVLLTLYPSNLKSNNRVGLGLFLAFLKKIFIKIKLLK